MIASASGLPRCSCGRRCGSAGLSFAAQEIYTQIDKIDASALQFDQSGIAKAVDKNNDGKVDKQEEVCTPAAASASASSSAASPPPAASSH